MAGNNTVSLRAVIDRDTPLSNNELVAVDGETTVGCNTPLIREFFDASSLSRDHVSIRNRRGQVVSLTNHSDSSPVHVERASGASVVASSCGGNVQLTDGDLIRFDKNSAVALRVDVRTMNFGNVANVGRADSANGSDTDAEDEEEQDDVVGEGVELHADENGIVKLTCTEGTSRKFWRVAHSDRRVVVHFGRIGTVGVWEEKTFATAQLARDYIAAKVHEKLTPRKGYRLSVEALDDVTLISFAERLDEGYAPPVRRGADHLLVQQAADHTRVVRVGDGMVHDATHGAVAVAVAARAPVAALPSQPDREYVLVKRTGGDEGEMLHVQLHESEPVVLVIVNSGAAMHRFEAKTRDEAVARFAGELQRAVDKGFGFLSVQAALDALPPARVPTSPRLSAAALAAEARRTDKRKAPTIRSDNDDDDIDGGGDVEKDVKRRRVETPMTLTLREPLNEIPVEGDVQLEKYKLSRRGKAYSCSCAAWRFQNAPINMRSCKHLREYLGDEFESDRIAVWTEHKAKSGLGGTVASPRRGKKNATGVGADVGVGAAKAAPGVMLAHKYDPSKNLAGWLCSEKLDGVRAWWDGKSLISRLGNVFDAPPWFKDLLPGNVDLDGELFFGRGKFRETISIVRSFGGDQRWKEIVYCVFDAPKVDGHLVERLESLHQMFGVDGTHANEQVRVVEHVTMVRGDAGEVAERLKVVEDQGGEGLIVRAPHSKYVGSRSTQMLKVKSFQDEEARIIAVEPGKGRHVGRVGALRGKFRNGAEFKVGTGLSDADREQFQLEPPIGKYVTVRYFEKSKAGVPRFPVFVAVRDDFDGWSDNDE